ncbi:MAG TPA: dihydropteroate synthase [Rectinemataceae bacterium]|nr:dihydropteroate synthase [Rectinemataceae bacterium]
MIRHEIPLPRGRRLVIDDRPLVMGIINVTPDSFYPGSRRRSCVEALDTARAMSAAGAALIDVGGESTRPGSESVSLDEELERVVPVIEAVRGESDLPISVDTRKAAVAAAALDAGADIVNDIGGLRHDLEMAPLVSARGVPVVIMHMLGEPRTMQVAPLYGDCPAEVRDFLLEAAARAQGAGIARGNIILDPGIGFGKRLEDNLAILHRLEELVATGFPVLVGLSRKAFVGAITGKHVEGRLAGSLGAACAAYLKGARIFRVHDVAETVDALAVLRSSLAGAAPEPAESVERAR